MLKALRLHKPSTYLAFAVWGAGGFMAQPTFASFIVHMAVTPVLLFCLLYVAHWESEKAGS